MSSSVPTVHVALVRHGSTDLNIARRIQGESERGLNEAGVEQAADAGRRLHALRSEGWDALVSSPQRRARETAAEIGVELQLEPLAPLPDLCERRYGAAEGLTFPQLYEQWAVPEARRGVGGVLDELIANGLVSGAEPIEEVRGRGLRALHELRNGNDLAADRWIVAVSHGTLIRCTLEAIGHDEPLHIENGGSVLLVSSGDGWRVDAVHGEASRY